MTDNEKLDLILEKVISLDEKVDNLTVRMDNLTERVDNLTERVDSLTERVDNLTERMDNIESDIHEIKQKTDRIDLTLENEIRVNIQRIAEGHLDLSRNLHEALKVDSEKEMLSIRVTVLETELRNIKIKLGNIA